MRLIFLLLFTSCMAEKGTLTYSLDGQSVSPVRERPEIMTLEFIQDQLLFPQCIQCHDWVSEPQEILRRIQPGEPQRSRLFRIMENGRMPPRPAAPVSSAELELLREYILQLSR